jgi:hypothetical protein
VAGTGVRVGRVPLCGHGTREERDAGGFVLICSPAARRHPDLPFMAGLLTQSAEALVEGDGYDDEQADVDVLVERVHAEQVGPVPQDGNQKRT